MDVAEALVHAGPLVDDLVATVPLEREAARNVVLEYLTDPYWVDDDPWWLHHLVESVQEQIQEDRIKTTWPPCPRHLSHPLWLEEPPAPELWWVCRRDDQRIARLGALSAPAG